MNKTITFDTFENLHNNFIELLSKTDKIQVLLLTKNNKYILANVKLYKGKPDLSVSGTVYNSIDKIAIL